MKVKVARNLNAKTEMVKCGICSAHKIRTPKIFFINSIIKGQNNICAHI